jgi:hypothetical protein
MAPRQQHVHDKGHKQGDGKRGSAHDEGLCSHDSWPKKAGPSLDGGVLSVWVPTASRNSACARRDKIDTMQSKERAHCGRQRHLQSDRLGSMAGSQATAGLRGGVVRDSGHLTNSEPIRLSPASARRPGPQQGEGFSAHLALRTRRRGGGDEQRNSLEQRKQGGAVHGFHGDVFPVLQPRSLASR